MNISGDSNKHQKHQEEKSGLILRFAFIVQAHDNMVSTCTPDYLRHADSDERERILSNLDHQKVKLIFTLRPRYYRIPQVHPLHISSR